MARCQKEIEDGDASLCMDRISKASFHISTRMAKLLRHSHHLRESDGAVPWNILIHNSKGFETAKWALKNGTDKVRFEYCVCVRSVQGQSGGQHIDPILQSNVPIPHGWTDYIYHVGSTFDYRSISEGGLVVGGVGVREGCHTCFFTAVDPMEASMLTPRYEPNEPWNIPLKLRWGLRHTAAYWFNLKLAQQRIGTWANHHQCNHII